MDKTLKAFYYGNLTPWDKRRLRGADKVCAVKELSDARDQLAQLLPPDLYLALDRLMKAQENLDGFKTGARFMMDIMDDTRETLKPITE